MCGILRHVRARRHAAARDAGGRARDERRLAHRGPDGDGFLDRGGASLGHRRLAIIDRAGGAQPMANEDETCWIVFNGEIYNHRDAAAAARSRRAIASARRATPRRSFTPTRSSARRASIGSRACSRSRSTTSAGASCSPHAIAWARSRSSTRCSTACCTSPASCRRLPRVALWKGELDLTASKATCRSAISSRRARRSTATSTSSCPATGCTSRTAGSTTATYWDVTEFDYRPARRRRDARRDRRDARQAVHDRLESEVPLGAFLTRRHRLGPGRVVHGRGARRSPGHDVVGFGEAAHNELEPPRV